MRLSHSKIDYLAVKLIRIMRERPDIEFNISETELERVIAWEITDELKVEEEIDEEVDALLAQYERQIIHQDLDQMMLRRKLKNEIARKRGYTL